MNQSHPLNRDTNLMVSISGLRGIIPSGLDLDNLPLLIRAFSKIISGKSIVIGRDSRPSGEYIEKITSGILLSLGKNVISIGITSTPTVKSVVKETKSDAGIMISASHNPIHWNAFKFIGKNGFFFQQKDIDLLKKYLSDKLPDPLYNPNSTYRTGEEFEALHIDSVLKRVELPAIKKRKFKVLIDAVNGGGSFIVPKLLRNLGCEVIEVNCKPDGKFPRPPEPTLKALKKTSELMKQSKADIGFALDPDADRLVVLTPERGVISEEYTLPLSIQSPLISPVKSEFAVVNLSTSFLTQDVLNPFGKKLLRSKVGELNVVQLMQEKKAFFGGEGNGGVIDPSVSSFGRDSLSGIAHILNFLSINKIKIDRVLDQLPALHMKKVSYSIKNTELKYILEKFKNEFSKFRFDEKDGLRIELESSWIHIRASNTEPIIRIIAEARSEKDLKSLLHKSSSMINS